jgi:hypothetical protein
MRGKKDWMIFELDLNSRVKGLGLQVADSEID